MMKYYEGMDDYTPEAHKEYLRNRNAEHRPMYTPRMPIVWPDLLVGGVIGGLFLVLLNLL